MGLLFLKLFVLAPCVISFHQGLCLLFQGEHPSPEDVLECSVLRPPWVSEFRVWDAQLHVSIL